MDNKISAICISTLKNQNLSVLMESIRVYVPLDVDVYINYCGALGNYYHNGRTILQSNYKADTYGAAYNYVVHEAFKKHSTILVCNDDAVFTPTTYALLEQDYNYLIHNHNRHGIGWIGCLTDYAIGAQNIRMDMRVSGGKELRMNEIKREREYYVYNANFIAPICGLITKQAWIDYLPINSFSDTIQCIQMRNKGLEHFVSRSYVHHVGSQSMQSYEKEHTDALEILRQSHPEEYQLLRKHLNLTTE